VTEQNIQSMMETVVQSFQPEKAAGIDAKVYFHLSGNQGGDWVATIRDQKLMIEPGTTQNPDLMLSADTQDLMDLFSGKLKPMQAYMQGKVQFKGDMGLAMRLAGLFKRP
jgi:putative sterol carrier protein